MWRMKDKTLSGLDKAKLTKNYTTYAVLLLSLGAMTFFGVCDPTGQQGGSGPKGSAAKVQGEVITRSEFNRAYRMTYDRYQRQFSDAFDPTALRLAYRVMKELVDDRAMYLKAVELGARSSDDEIIKLLAQAEQFKDEKTGKFDTEGLQKFLDSQGYTQASFMEELRRSITLQKFQRMVRETIYVSQKASELDYILAETKLNLEYLKFDPQTMEVTIDQAEIDKLVTEEAGKKRIKEYYDGNSKEFQQPEQIKARHILIAFQGARNASPEAGKRDKEAARKLAQEIEAKVKAPGADFIAIAKESTDEAVGKTSGGDLGWFAKEAMVKEFSDAAFAQELGSISTLVESPFGFHIIKVEEKKPAKNISLEAAQAEIAKKLLEKEKKPAIAKERAEKFMAAVKEGRDLTALLTEYKLSWAETGEFALNSSYVQGIGSSKEIASSLAELRSVGQLSKAPIDVRGNLYVLRLKSRVEPDLTKLDDNKRQELAQSASYAAGMAAYQGFEKQLSDQLEAGKKIWMNPEYLALDTPQEAPEDASKPSS